MSKQYFTRPNVQPVITYIGTTPEQRQMSTEEFKAKFDEMPEAIQQYIKETLLTELDAFKQEFMTHQAEFAKLGSQVMVVARDVTLEGIQRINTINKPKAILIYAVHGGARFSIGSWSENGTSYAAIINLDELFVVSVSSYQQIHVHQQSAGNVGFSGKITNATDTGFDIEWSINNPTLYNLTGNVSLRIQVWYG